MSKVDYNIDIDVLTPEEFECFMELVDEIAYEDGRSKEEIISQPDYHIEYYWEQACERYHFHTQRIERSLRKLQNLDVYEVNEQKQVKYFGTFETRFHLSLHLDKIYNLYSAIAFSPESCIGYMIHGTIDDCRTAINDLKLLHQKIEVF